MGSGRQPPRPSTRGVGPHVWAVPTALSRLSEGPQVPTREWQSLLLPLPLAGFSLCFICFTSCDKSFW